MERKRYVDTTKISDQEPSLRLLRYQEILTAMNGIFVGVSEHAKEILKREVTLFF